MQVLQLQIFFLTIQRYNTRAQSQPQLKRSAIRNGSFATIRDASFATLLSPIDYFRERGKEWNTKKSRVSSLFKLKGLNYWACKNISVPKVVKKDMPLLLEIIVVKNAFSIFY